MRECPNCGANGTWLSYRLNGTTECQNCGYRSSDQSFIVDPSGEYQEES